MFFFGKKKKEKKQEQAVPVVNKEELIAKASEKVTELESKTGDERVSLLNEIGSLYTQAEETDDEKVKEYMDKVQNLMQMSKDMIRGNA